MGKQDMEVILGTLEGTDVKTASALREKLASADASTKAAKPDALTARERITMFFDEGTFVETGVYVSRRMSEFDAGAPDEFEGVITGWGSVNGKLAYAFSQDISRTKGAVSETQANKIAEIYRLATENGAPVIGMFDSAGAYLPEGVRALAGYAKIMKSVSLASGVVPQIAIVPGLAQGAGAVIAAMFDFVIVTETNSVLSVNPPFNIGAEAGKAAYTVDTGIASICAANETAAIMSARELVSVLPLNNVEGTEVTDSNDEINRLVDISAYDSDKKASTLITAFADDGKYIELYKDYAAEMSTGFVSVGNIVCGVVANNYAVNGGTLTPNAARKAAKMVSFCDAFNIPVITVVDSKGMDATMTSEGAPYAVEVGKLAGVYASARTPLVTVVAGEAYGTVYAVMGSKALGADVCVSLDTAKIGCMNSTSAVAFLWNDKVTSSVTREDLAKAWDATVGSPVAAAKAGEIDDIISSEEIRQRVAAYISMLQVKSKNAVQRRHSNMPL